MAGWANLVVLALALGLELIEFLVQVFSLSRIRWSGAARRADFISEWEWGKRRGEERQNLLALM